MHQLPPELKKSILRWQHHAASAVPIPTIEKGYHCFVTKVSARFMSLSKCVWMERDVILDMCFVQHGRGAVMTLHRHYYA